MTGGQKAVGKSVREEADEQWKSSFMQNPHGYVMGCRPCLKNN